MISTSELMLGNWVNAYNDFYKIELIAETYVHASNAELDCTDIYPIPITDTLLEKCGFIKECNLWIIDESMIFEPFRSANVLCYYGQRIEGIKYLHELQNAYFMLTKKYLDINL